MDIKAYFILGNNKDTQEPIDHLRRKGSETITIVDEDLEKTLSRRGDLAYVKGIYVDSIKDLPFVY